MKSILLFIIALIPIVFSGSDIKKFFAVYGAYSVATNNNNNNKRNTDTCITYHNITLYNDSILTDGSENNNCILQNVTNDTVTILCSNGGKIILSVMVLLLFLV